MEDILDLYKLPYDPLRPVVCLDEASRQLIETKRKPIPMKPGQPQKYDYEYSRNGTKVLTMIFEPLAGWREVIITDQRRKIEWVEILMHLADEVYPYVDKIVLVQDNLNTHRLSGFYEVLTPDKAKQYVDRFETHYTPKHASWLDMAESELSILSRQCLSARIPNEQELTREVEAWCFKRNSYGNTMDWQFDTDTARIRLKHLYPKLSE